MLSKCEVTFHYFPIFYQALPLNNGMNSEKKYCNNFMARHNLGDNCPFIYGTMLSRIAVVTFSSREMSAHRTPAEDAKQWNNE
jgi:hypothetical protein